MSAKPISAEALLFDLDGTLVDTLPDLAEAAARTLSDLGLPVSSPREIRHWVGDGIAELVRRFMAANGRTDPAEVAEATARFKAHYAEVNGMASRPYEGVPETLAELSCRGLVMGCVTNKDWEFTLPLLEALDLAPFFDVVVAGDTLPVKKPDPAMVLHACEHLNRPAERALLIGDSAIDAQAGQGAGVAVALVTYGYGDPESLRRLPAAVFLDRFPELLNYLA
ncbi:phosphoglycolate phosphatase [Tepidiphilus margaritifer]|uniref:phosphoglycolate phosphatase n=1 Tax=Tepidiphilus margaritifer TaxID=203471 RepID=UPI000406ACBE|nr:phosphoglycolate phosphatase [Tepidiphilus margaritifer]